MFIKAGAFITINTVIMLLQLIPLVLCNHASEKISSSIDQKHNAKSNKAKDRKRAI